jgi:leucyl aminopeptidase
MVSDLGATAVDRDMTVALVAAMQAKAFPMPSMKKADTVTTEQATYNLTFICEETEEPQTDTSNNVDDGSIGKSLSGLELAMLEASRARTPPAPAVLRPLPSGLDLLATIAQQRVLNEAHNLARALAAAPPNVLTPASYAAFVRTLACAMDV